MDKVLVTGGAGFVGSHLVDSLVGRFKVTVVDDLSHGNLKNVNSKAEFIQQNLNKADVSNLLKSIKPDYIVHLAAQTSLSRSNKDPNFDIETNLIQTVKILEAIKKTKLKIKKFIFASSAAVYGFQRKIPVKENAAKLPISMYGISKLSAEFLVQLYSKQLNISYAILRFSNVYGRRQDSSGEGGVVAIFINRLRNRKAVEIYGDGKQTRDFIHVTDVVMAISKALERNESLVANVSRAMETSILELIKIMERTCKTEAKVIHKPAIKEVTRNSLSYDNLKNLTGWEPSAKLNQGLLETL